MNVSLFSMFCMIGFDKVFIIEQHVEQTNSFGWVEMYESPIFSDKHYFVRLPKDEGDVLGHYKHIAMVSYEVS